MERIRRFLRWTRDFNTPIRLSGATAVVTSTTLIQWLAWRFLVHHPYFLFVISVGLCAFVFEKEMGIFALVLSLIATSALFRTPVLFFGSRIEEDPAMAVFIFASLVAIVISALIRSLAAALDELDERQATLLKEMRHRTRNNFQIVSSTVNWEATRAAHEETRASLQRVARRIAGIAHITEALNQPGQEGLFDAREYLVSLVGQIAASLAGGRGVEVLCNAESVKVDHDTAELLGVIVNELITNSVKHAFPSEKTGAVRVEFFQRPEDGRLCLTVSDNGVGCASEAGKGTGLGLVAALVRLRGGSLAMENAEPGCRVTVTMKLRQP